MSVTAAPTSTGGGVAAPAKVAVASDINTMHSLQASAWNCRRARIDGDGHRRNENAKRRKKASANRPDRVNKDGQDERLRRSRSGRPETGRSLRRLISIPVFRTSSS